MEDIRGINHTKWECKYHVVWIPRYRKKTLYAELRKSLGSTFRDLAAREVYEGSIFMDFAESVDWEMAMLFELSYYSNDEWIKVALKKIVEGKYRPGLGACKLSE